MMPRYPPTNEGWKDENTYFKFEILLGETFEKNFVYFIVNNQKEKEVARSNSILKYWVIKDFFFKTPLALNQLFILNSTNLLNH